MKKQDNAKKVNKPLAKKVVPFVMSTSMVAASFLAAGAPISAAELDGKEVTPEVIEQAKNHGQKVSDLAKSLKGPFENDQLYKNKGQMISELAKDKSFKTERNVSEDSIEESANDDLATEEGEEGTEAPADAVAEEGEASDDVTAEEGTETLSEPVAEEDAVSDDAPETEGGTVAPEEVPTEPVAQEDEASDNVTGTEEVVEEGTVAPEEEIAAETETSNEAAPVDETTVENEDQEDASINTWVDDNYEVIGNSYQSLIGNFQTLIGHYFGQIVFEQTNNEAQQLDTEQSNDDSQELDSEQSTDDTANVNDDLSEVSADAEVLDNITEEDSTTEANDELVTPLDNAEAEVVNNSAEMEEGQVDLGENQPEVQEDAELEGNSEQPELPVNEVSSEDETVNQNEQDLNQEEEVEKDPSNENSVKDKLIGYYQDLVASFSNFMSFLK